MKKPKMIIFDYGDTLLCEPSIDFLRGTEVLFEYVKSNRNNLTPKGGHSQGNVVNHTQTDTESRAA